MSQSDGNFGGVRKITLYKCNMRKNGKGATKTNFTKECLKFRMFVPAECECQCRKVQQIGLQLKRHHPFEL